VAREAGLDVPETLRPRGEAELRELVARLDLDHQRYLLRLDVWADGPADPASGAFTLPGGETREELLERALEIFERTGSMPILQEVVRGNVDSSIGVAMVVARDGRPLVAYEIRRLGLYAYSRGGGFDHPYTLGANVYAESAHDPEARRAAERLIAHSGYYGAVTVEFRRDERNGRLRFIKTDCRIANAVSLSTALGMDAPTALYREFSGEGSVGLAPKHYRDGIGWLWLDRYLRTIRENKAAATRPVLTLLRRAHRVRAFGFASIDDRAPMWRTWRKEWARMRTR
jgi:predicted ATP-grasp superfamily ATP-dependent carboligase